MEKKNERIEAGVNTVAKMSAKVRREARANK